MNNVGLCSLRFLHTDQVKLDEDRLRKIWVAKLEIPHVGQVVCNGVLPD